jgi:hypothetical protein
MVTTTDDLQLLTASAPPENVVRNSHSFANMDKKSLKTNFIR